MPQRRSVLAALLVAVLGLVFVGFAPDALIRPRLARLTTGMPASLYFVGFTGGVLTVGVVGVIAGPLVVALLAEVVELLSSANHATQQHLDRARHLVALCPFRIIVQVDVVDEPSTGPDT